MNAEAVNSAESWISSLPIDQQEQARSMIVEFSGVFDQIRSGFTFRISIDFSDELECVAFIETYSVHMALKHESEEDIADMRSRFMQMQISPNLSGIIAVIGPKDATLDLQENDALAEPVTLA